jgi:hypothetical protein
MGRGPLWSSVEDDLLRKSYGKVSGVELRELFPNRTESGIRSRAVKCLGLHGKEPREAQLKYYRNDNVFDELSLSSCYWGGLIATDGSVSRKRNVLKISLDSKDHEHLVYLKDYIEYDGNVNQYLDKRYGSYMSQLSINGASKILDDLERHFNIIPNKTFSLLPPNIEDDELCKSYIVGHFDGDGSQWIEKRNNRFYIQWAGNESMLQWIYSKLHDFFPGHSCSKIYPQGNIFRYQFSGKKAEWVHNELSQVDVPKMSRKWEVNYATSCN